MRRIVVVVFCLSLMVGCPKPQEPPPLPPVAVFSFINVAKADAMILEVDGEVFLFDTGTVESVNKLVEAMEILELESITAVILSHADKDHIGGFNQLSKQKVITSVYYSEIGAINDGPVPEIARDREIAINKLSYQQEVSLSENCSFLVLSPQQWDTDDNNNSLVILLKVFEYRILLTGDILKEVEQQIITSQNPLTLKADILKVGYHGRRESSSEEFIRLVKPNYAIICTDRYKEPRSAAEVVLLTLQPAEVFITDEYRYGLSFFLTRGEGISYAEITKED